jgi:hypothetical protein
VITLAAQPAEKGAFEELGVEPVGLGSRGGVVLPRLGDILEGGLRMAG